MGPGRGGSSRGFGSAARRVGRCTGQVGLFPLDAGMRGRRARYSRWSGEEWAAITRRYPLGATVVGTVANVFPGNREDIVRFDGCSSVLEYEDDEPAVAHRGRSRHRRRPMASRRRGLRFGVVNRVRNSHRCCRRSARWAGSIGGNRRPDPHGHGSLPPSFSTSSVSCPTTRSPRLTWDSLEGTPYDVCCSAQKDVSSFSSRRMMTSLELRRPKVR
jgi:hypothetical protein